MFQIAGDDRSWSCVGECVLDVLLEMERERDKKEKVVGEILPRVYPRNPLTKLLFLPLSLLRVNILVSLALLGPPAAQWKSQPSPFNWQASHHLAPKLRTERSQNSSWPIRFRTCTVVHLWHRQFTGTGCALAVSKIFPCMETVALFVFDICFQLTEGETDEG